MPENDDPRPARLPRTAPDRLKRFVRCEADDVTLDLGSLDWLLNDIPLLRGAAVTVLPGSTSSGGTVRIDAEWTPAFDLRVSIVDGELRVTVEGAAGAAFNDAIREWTDALNRTLRRNGKQLRDVRVEGRELTLRKQAIPRPATGVAPVTTPTTTTAGEPAPDTTPAPTPTPPARRGGCLGMILAGVAAIAAAIGITLAVTGDDDGGDAGSTDAITTDGAPPTDGPTPATDGSGADASPAAGSATTGGGSGGSGDDTTGTGGRSDDGSGSGDRGTEDGRDDGDTGDDGGTGSGDDGAGGERAALPPCGLPPDGTILTPGSYPDLPGDGRCRLGDDGTGAVPADPYPTCDPVFLPCSDGTNLIFTVAGGRPGIDHTRSVPDADTGESGASTAEHAFYARYLGSAAEAIARLTSDCGGTLLTGQTTLADGEITVLDQPLVSFGSCRVVGGGYGFPDEPDGDDAERDVDFFRPLLLPFPDEYVVGPDEPDPQLPIVPTDRVVTDPRFRIEADWADDARTVQNTLGAATIDDDCFFFVDPANVELIVRVLDGAGCTDRFWVFYAATTGVEFEVTVTDVGADVLLGHGGAHVNPLGEFASVGDTEAFRTSGPLFDDSLFPCGPGHVALTVCPGGDADTTDVDAGAFVAVGAMTLDTIPLQPDGTERSHSVDFGPAGGGSWTVAQDADGWTIESDVDATRARALLRGNSVTVVIPVDELPGGPLSYEWSTTVDGTTHTQPAAPVSGLITTPQVAADAADDTVDDVPTTDSAPATEPDPAAEPVPDAPVESPADFYAQLSASIAAGDLGFALDRLDPRVREVYPDSCPAALERFADPEFAIEFLSEDGVEPWTWEVEGRSIEIPDAVTVTIRLTGRGQTGEPTTSHLTVVDGRYRWFTFC